VGITLLFEIVAQRIDQGLQLHKLDLAWLADQLDDLFVVKNVERLADHLKTNSR